MRERIRAGVLEQGTVDLMVQSGVGARLKREGLVHNGDRAAIQSERASHRLRRSTGGKSITIYAQHEVIKDLVAARVCGRRADCYFRLRR